MIYTVTLNPSQDKTLSVAELRPGEVHRAQWAHLDLGGKGINVSRALRMLGLESEIVAALAGATGRALRNGLEASGFQGHYLWLEGETRMNLTLRDESRNLYTKINEPGPRFNPEQMSELKQLISKLAKPGDIWAFCGSLPPGAPPDLYAHLIRQVQAVGSRAFLDASGPALGAGVSARPFALKPNLEEASELLQRSLTTVVAQQQAVGDLRASGIALVALSRGRDGMLLAVGDVLMEVLPPSVTARSPIGAGDAALAGLIWATIEDCDPVEMARRAVACGTAAAMQEGTGLGTRAMIESLLPKVQTRILSL